MKLALSMYHECITKEVVKLRGPSIKSFKVRGLHIKYLKVALVLRGFNKITYLHTNYIHFFFVRILSVDNQRKSCRLTGSMYQEF